MARVLVPLAEGFEELEAVTVIDLLRRARFEVAVAGLSEGAVTGSRGTVIVPDVELESVLQHPFELIVLPGGLPGSDNLDNDNRIHRLLKQISARGGYIAAICAAPKVLANAGLLDGRRATAYPGVLERMAVPGLTLSAEPVVHDRNIITSRGPATAMDFALVLIELLASSALRKEVESALLKDREPTF